MDPAARVPARDLARYFGLAPEVLPLLDEILADLSELGSDPHLVAQWLEEAGLTGSARVLDLGCGKGAVAIALAERLGCRVDGVDAFEPFVLEARRRAEAAGVSRLCSFEVGDLREVVGRPRGYDAVLYVSVGDVLGPLEESVRALREAVRVGGYLVVDDGYRLAGVALAFPGYELMLTRDEALRALAASGDRIVRERLFSVEEARAQNERYFAHIVSRVRDLAIRHPERADLLAAYVEKEKEENRLLETAVQCAVWMVQRIG